MLQDPPARMTDDLVEWVIRETEAETSTTLDGLGPTELQFLASALITKGEERPKNDEQQRRYLRAAARLLDRAIAGGLGR
jgi:hypothetical protein